METDPQAYLRAMTQIYISLPEAPRRLNRYDRQVALHWFQQQISLPVVEAAFSWPRCAALAVLLKAAPSGPSAPSPTSNRSSKKSSKIRSLLPTSPICGASFRLTVQAPRRRRRKGGQLRGAAVQIHSFSGER